MKQNPRQNLSSIDGLDRTADDQSMFSKELIREHLYNLRYKKLFHSLTQTKLVS